MRKKKTFCRILFKLEIVKCTEVNIKGYNTKRLMKADYEFKLQSYLIESYVKKRNTSKQ